MTDDAELIVEAVAAPNGTQVTVVVGTPINNTYTANVSGSKATIVIPSADVVTATRIPAQAIIDPAGDADTEDFFFDLQADVILSDSLSCPLTNASIVVNGGNSVQYGGGPYEISMEWTGEDGSYAGAPPVTGLTASVGTISYQSQQGAHPKNIYLWTVPQSGSATDVNFFYGESVGGQQCIAPAVVTLDARGSGGSTSSGATSSLEGFGTDSAFCRDLANGSAVVAVTNLNDSGSGSLREALARTDTRYVIPLMDGTVTALSTMYVNGKVAILGAGSNMLVRSHPSVGYVTILMDQPEQIIRYMKIASGQSSLSSEQARKPIQSESHTHVIDHCSLLFGVDDIGSSYQDDGTGNQSSNATWSHNLFGIGLQRSHTGTSTSGKGLLCSGIDQSVHHNVFYSTSYRAPQVSGPFADVRNNIGLSSGGILIGEVYDQYDVYANVINNIELTGATIDIHASRHGYDDRAGDTRQAITYVSGNVDGNGNPLPVTYNRGDANAMNYNQVQSSAILTSPSSAFVPSVTTHTTAELEAYLLPIVGANLQGRTDVENDIINRIINRTTGAFDAVSGDSLYPQSYSSDAAVYARKYPNWPTITPSSANPNFDLSQIDLVPNSWKASKGIAADSDTTMIDLNGNGIPAFELYYEEVTGCPPF